MLSINQTLVLRNNFFFIKFINHLSLIVWFHDNIDLIEIKKIDDKIKYLDKRGNHNYDYNQIVIFESSQLWKNLRIM